MSALSHIQKRDLSILARQAFEKKRAALVRLFHLELDGNFYDAIGNVADAQTVFLLRGDTASANEWRHHEVARACGKDGLRCCGQNDFNPVLAHFQRMLGNNAAANHATQRSATDERRTAEFKLGQALRELNLGISYANGICKKMFGGTALNEASVKQLWKIYFALRKQIGRLEKV